MPSMASPNITSNEQWTSNDQRNIKQKAPHRSQDFLDYCESTEAFLGVQGTIIDPYVLVCQVLFFPALANFSGSFETGLKNAQIHTKKPLLLDRHNFFDYIGYCQEYKTKFQGDPAGIRTETGIGNLIASGFNLISKFQNETPCAVRSR
ncbi:MAG: hypothetical protein DWH73_03930 [Planctomycetota bacterium]|nr:MAG: hypothetical protein DWH73_03930 [Planctomycetota bacterium]